MSRRVLLAELDTFGMMVWKQLVVMFRYPVEFVASFVQIFIIILMFTFATLMFAPRGTNGAGTTESGVPIGPVMMYGFVLFMFVSDSIWTLGVSLRWEQYQGTLESLYLTPANKLANLVSRVAPVIVWTGLLCLAALAFVQLVLGRLPFHNLPLANYLLAMTLAGTFGFGFCFAAYTLLVKESAQATANFLQFVLMVVCGMLFPFSALPEPVRLVSRLVPLSYAVDAFRSTLMGYPAGFPELAPIDLEIGIVTAFGLVTPLVGFWLYSLADRKVRRDGTLAEF
jgi:ABC-2 type transport system permease protein